MILEYILVIKKESKISFYYTWSSRINLFTWIFLKHSEYLFVVSRYWENTITINYKASENIIYWLLNFLEYSNTYFK